MIVGTDGRLALIMSGIIWRSASWRRNSPARCHSFIFPLITLAVALLVYCAGLQYDADNFGGGSRFRPISLPSSMYPICWAPPNVLLGPAADAGLAYLILSQSLFGVIILWSYISLGSRADTPAQIRYYHSTSLWLSLFMMVGAAFLTIKTAGLLWFIYGSLQRDQVAVPAPNRSLHRGTAGTTAYVRGPSATPPAAGRMQRMPNEVKSIHYLRGLAALLVVFHHSIIQLAPVRDHYAHIEFGQAGVDIFFVISGFVIYLSNAKGRLGSAEFLKRRIIRIVPLYWLATLAVVAVAVVAPRLFATTTVTAQNVAQSLLFVPAYSSAFPDQIWPVLVPGWSLNYEMFFYLVFAVGLLVARERLLLFLVATLGILVVAGLLLDPHPAPLKSYTDLRLLEFLFGVLLARLYLDMGFKGLSGLGILLPAGILLLAISPALPMLELGKIPPWALPAALIVTGALAMERLLLSTSSPLLQLMGDASYALYLSHLFTLGALRVIWAKAGVPVDNPQWILLWFAVALSTSVVVGIAVHKWLEKPLLSAGRSLLARGPTAGWRKVPMRSTGVPGE